MAVDLSELIELRDRLVMERGSGVSAVQLGDERIEFKNDAQMAAAIADLEARIRRASATSTASNAVRFSTSKGM